MIFDSHTNTIDLSLNSKDYSLLTDLYQLTMTAVYIGEELADKPAVFELFVRKLPKNFGYLVAMGLEQVLEFLQEWQFTTEHINYLQDTGIFNNAPAAFWQTLSTAKFTGKVWAVPEGTIIFANEPILRIEAPLWQGQLIETFLLNVINYQTMIATKAARIRDVAGIEAQLYEFGTRRAFSGQGALWAARSSLAGGLNFSSNILASKQLGCQPVGTMAHALVMALCRLKGDEKGKIGELGAYQGFHKYFPGAPLLIDTYDPLVAAQMLAEEIKAKRMELTGIRLDSGDLVKLSQEIKEILPNIKIIASGDLDEMEIKRLETEGSKIDGYALGTKLVTGSPVNGVYKLVEIDGLSTMKKSVDKMTLPGKKQIRRESQGGKWDSDRLCLASEGEGLLELVYDGRKSLLKSESVEIIRQRVLENVASLPQEIRAIENPVNVKVNISDRLEELTQQTLTNLG